jgi:hypothetical protein
LNTLPTSFPKLDNAKGTVFYKEQIKQRNRLVNAVRLFISSMFLYIKLEKQGAGNRKKKKREI